MCVGSLNNSCNVTTYLIPYILGIWTGLYGQVFAKSHLMAPHTSGHQEPQQRKDSDFQKHSQSGELAVVDSLLEFPAHSIAMEQICKGSLSLRDG